MLNGQPVQPMEQQSHDREIIDRIRQSTIIMLQQFLRRDELHNPVLFPIVGPEHGPEFGAGQLHREGTHLAPTILIPRSHCTTSLTQATLDSRR